MGSTGGKSEPGTVLVVIGASAGGIEALQQLLPAIPEDFAAAIAIVVHRQPFEEDERLARVLGRGAALPVHHAVNRQPIEAGRIVVCPASVHLSVSGGRFVLDAGPRENNVRPAIDVLFRSAAAARGPSVAGVLLSGLLDDGTDGLAAIHSRGGLTIVQDPNEALFADMPRHALEGGHVDVVAPAVQIAGVLVDFANGVHPKAIRGGAFPERSQPSEYACPDCHGVLWRVESAVGDRFRCRTGHAYTPVALHERQSEVTEEALWAAIRSLEEHGDASKALALRLRDRGLSRQAQRLERAATSAKRRSIIIRSALPDVDEAESAADAGDESSFGPTAAAAVTLAQ